MSFRVVVLDVLRRHCRGMALFYKESPRFVVEEHQQNGPNVISFHLVAGGRRWYVVGCYLVPHDAFTLERVFSMIGHRPRVTELLVAEYFNTGLESLDGNKRDEVISSSM